MSISPQFIAWKMAMEISPILLTGGIASSLGGVIPIVTLTTGANLISSVLQTGFSPELDNFFARYVVLPGASLVNNQVSTYPFANQAVAANAIIAQPLNVSYRMICPAGPNSGGYPIKLLTMQALQQSLQQHTLSGGLFTCITPSGIYPNGLLLNMRDISGGESNQAQYIWQLDFTFPLVTMQQAQAAQNGLMQAITNGTPSSSTLAPSLPGAAAGGLTVGNPFKLLTASLVPASTQSASLLPSTVQ